MAQLRISVPELCNLLNENVNQKLIRNFHSKNDLIFFDLITSLDFPEKLKLGLELLSFDNKRASFLVHGKGVKLLSRLAVVKKLVIDTLSEIEELEVDLPYLHIDINGAIGKLLNGVSVKQVEIANQELKIYTS